jgi:hypothetical protein
VLIAFNTPEYQQLIARAKEQKELDSRERSCSSCKHCSKMPFDAEVVPFCQRRTEYWPMCSIERTTGECGAEGKNYIWVCD